MFQTWEKAIELCKELAEQYQSYLYDYMKLANILVCIYIYRLLANRRGFYVDCPNFGAKWPVEKEATELTIVESLAKVDLTCNEALRLRKKELSL